MDFFFICLMFFICIMNTKQTQMESNPKDQICTKQKGNVRELLIPRKCNVTKIYYHKKKIRRSNSKIFPKRKVSKCIRTI